MGLPRVSGHLTGPTGRSEDAELLVGAGGHHQGVKSIVPACDEVLFDPAKVYGEKK